MLTASLVLLMCVHAGALSAFLLRVARRRRAAQDDPRRARGLARQALIASIATMALQVILLGALVLAQLAGFAWWVWGITLAISFLAVVWLDGLRGKLTGRSASGGDQRTLPRARDRRR